MATNKSFSAQQVAVKEIIGNISIDESMVLVAINLDMVPVERGGDKNQGLLTLKGQGKMMSTSSKNGEVSGLPFMKASHFGLYDAKSGKQLDTQVDIDGEDLPLNIHLRSVSGELASQMLVASGMGTEQASMSCVSASALWGSLCMSLPSKGLQLQLVAIFDTDHGSPDSYEGRKWYSVPLGAENIVGFRVVTKDQAFYWSSISHAWKPGVKSQEIKVTVGNPPLTKKSGLESFKKWANGLFKKGLSKEEVLSQKDELLDGLTGRLADWVGENRKDAEDILDNWKVKAATKPAVTSAAEIEFSADEEPKAPTTTAADSEEEEVVVVAPKPVVKLKVNPVVETEAEVEATDKKVVEAEAVDFSEFGL